MEQIKEYKVVHAYIFEPKNALFKSSRNHKAECSIVKCNNSENCGLYARNQCSFLMVLGWQACPYGKFSKEEGYTSKANAYSKWINDRKELYKDSLSKLSSHSNVMTYVGDYVFLPYAHITMNEHVPFLAKGGFFLKENCFLKKEHFTIDNIINMLEFRPYAMMAGEITSYQTEEVPKFIKHLSEVFPEIYKELCLKYEKAKIVNDDYSYIGRKAYLNTISPNVGKLVDIHKGEWIWDGTYLTSYNSKASFMLADKFSEIRIKPLENAAIKITDNNQVNENTKFVD